MHLVQSVAGQQLPSHIPFIKIGGQSRVVAGVTLKGGWRCFSGVLTAGGAHRRGGGGLVPRTGCRGRVRPLGFVYLKPRGRDGSELGASATPLHQVGPFLHAGGSLWSTGSALPGHQAVHAWPATEHRRQTPVSAPGHSAAASWVRGAAASQHEGLQPQARLHLHSLPALSHTLQTGQHLHQWEHKKKLRHFPGLCSSHSLDTGDCSGRAGNMELSSALLWGNEP